ncbi:helix-turn-helix domain-containing protein [Nonomuraea zeae]|uniref:Transposase IS30-like HTH domain-containing protein n=1 Tax=Nonomuraea zeae TaxID=1642303 RepID=A0A5S4FXG3_9ACTN|nr:helix-turn-helix domain-containing protein [Nonomuraea zeae]TMR25369.1 hypothetical protein ETD85_45480 [Nonomuraea zeae]
MSNQEAFRIYGINSRTGRRRPNGCNPTGNALGDRHLNETERIHIAHRVPVKASIREIARELGRVPSHHQLGGS